MMIFVLRKLLSIPPRTYFILHHTSTHYHLTITHSILLPHLTLSHLPPHRTVPPQGKWTSSHQTPSSLASSIKSVFLFLFFFIILIINLSFLPKNIFVIILMFVFFYHLSLQNIFIIFIILIIPAKTSFLLFLLFPPEHLFCYYYSYYCSQNILVVEDMIDSGATMLKLLSDITQVSIIIITTITHNIRDNHKNSNQLITIIIYDDIFSRSLPKALKWPG